MPRDIPEGWMDVNLNMVNVQAAPRGPRPRFTIPVGADMRIIDDVPEGGQMQPEGGQVFPELTDEGPCQFPPELTPFKLPYQSRDEIHRRLTNTLIIVDGHPKIVADVQLENRDFVLFLMDEERQICTKRYSQVKSLRSVPPGYVSFTEPGLSGCYYFYRMPSTPGDRHGDYQQGVTPRNSRLKVTGSTGSVPIPNVQCLVSGLKNGKTIQWKPVIEEFLVNKMLRNCRLSQDFSVYFKKSPIVEFKGRNLAVLHDDYVKLDEEKDVPWIVEGLNRVGIHVR